MLSAVLVGGSLAWGVLVGSYFGVAPAPDSFWGRARVLEVGNFDTMMKLSVSIGVLHLVLANAEQAWLNRGRVAMGAPLGWIAALLRADSQCGWARRPGRRPGWYPAGAGPSRCGLVAVFAFSSGRAVRDLRSGVLRVLDGLQALTNVTRVFGDVLSYLRLFALGLASASLALTFNNLAREASSVQGLGLLFALLILLVGHVLNLALSLMSGVVHGLRLNYIEFYNWALSGEGYAFRPFKKRESDHE